jgi:hypothetical protein
VKRIVTHIIALLGSRYFLYGVIIFFSIEALWVAVSSLYPMAFDEDFHVGIITIYSQQWLPFLGGQPLNADQLGALQHDPSYLYHYLMSFPYRLIGLFTDSQTMQVIVLRLLNIGLFVWGLYLFCRVMRRVGISAALTHTALALFVLIPIVPLVAGQINYDNLLMPLTAWMCLSVCSLYEQFQKRTINLKTISLFVSLVLLTSLIKFPFLPIATAAVVFVCITGWRAFRGRGTQLRTAIRKGLVALSARTLIGLALLVLLSFGLFVERYGYNLAVYHHPVPECDAVLDEESCMAYGPWARNHLYAQAKGDVDPNPLAYTWHWLQALHYRLFFMVNGPHDQFRNYPPLPLPAAAAVIIAVSGMVALVLYWRRAFRGQPLLLFFAGVCILYALALWVDDYLQYLYTGEPVAINGRYLLPILLPLAIVIGRALHIALAQWQAAKAFAAGVMIVLFLQGGGVLSFILRSNSAWYWDSGIVNSVNHDARTILSPFIIEGSKYY